MNVCLNGNLVKLLVKHTNGLLIPKKKTIFTLASRCFTLYKNAACRFVLHGCKNQTPSLRLDVSLLRNNINIFINVSYSCMLNICVYKIYTVELQWLEHLWDHEICSRQG